MKIIAEYGRNKTHMVIRLDDSLNVFDAPTKWSLYKCGVSPMFNMDVFLNGLRLDAGQYS